MKIFYFLLFFIIFTGIVSASDFQTYRDSTIFYSEKQDYKLALKWSHLTLQAAEKEFGKSDSNFILTLVNHADNYRNLNQLDSAINTIESNFSIINNTYPNEHSHKILIYQYLAEFYEKKSVYKTAEKYYNDAYKMNKKLFGLNNFVSAILIQRLSSINRNMGRYDIAENFYSVGLKVFPNVFPDGEVNYAIFLNSYATYKKIIGDYKSSEENYLNAVNMMKNLNLESDINYVTFTNNLGSFYFGVANYEKSKEYFNKALQYFNKISKTENKLIATLYHNLAFIDYMLENYESAETLFLKAIEIKRRVFKDLHNDIAVSLKGLGDLYSDIKNYEKSENCYKEAIEIRRKIFKESHPDLGNAINSLGFLYFDKLHNYEKAIPLFNEALFINSKFYKKNNLESVSTLRNAALAFEYIGQIKKADSLWNIVINDNKTLLTNYFSVISEDEKILLLDKIANYIYGYNTFCIANHQNIPDLLTKLFNNQLYFKSIVLNESKKLQEIVNSSNDNSYIDLFNKWEQTKEQIAKYYAFSPSQLKSKNIDLDSIINFANEQERELTRKSANFKLLQDKKHFTIVDIQNQLSQNSAAIEFIRIQFKRINQGDDLIIYAALILKKDSKYPEIVVFNNGLELEKEHLQTYKNELKTDDEKKLSYNNYWSAIAEKLQGIKKVYISPDGVYNKINLSTLKNPKSKKYLDDEIEIVILTNLKDIIDINNEKLSQNASFELFGDPAFDELLVDSSAVIAEINRSANEVLDSNDRAGIQLNPLPNTRSEVEEISKILTSKKYKNTKYLGENANELTLKKLNNPTVLHLATHGYFLKDMELNDKDKSLGENKYRFNENPLLRSMLFFSGAKKSLKSTNITSELKHQDGILTAYEVQNLNLHHTELVVLAACETGLGEIKNGEGVYGLQRSFIQAGAKSIIMSLWQANDKATKELMVNFYKEWLNGKSKCEAFSLAKKQVRQKYRYPIFWGAYIMIGE